MNEPVSIIILNYNGKRFLKDCLSSVFSQSYANFELVLFDNNSADGSIEFVKQNFSDTRLNIISSKTNLGFAGGNNEALKHCKSDLVVLLNNDTITENDWLQSLVSAMNNKNTIASSFVVTEGVPEKYYISNGSVSYLMYNIMNIFPNIEDEFYPNGCSLIFRNSEIVEPFDKDYFFYGEDVYLGLKARFMDMKIKFVKGSVVHHFGSGTGSSGQFKTFCQERNKCLNLYLFFSPWFIIRMFPYIILNHTAKFILSLFSKKYSVVGVIKAYFWFYVNIPVVLNKRKELSHLKIVNEKEIIKYTSCKVFNDGSVISAFFNSISYIYSRLMGIKPIEFYQKNNIPY